VRVEERGVYVVKEFLEGVVIMNSGGGVSGVGIGAN
jgi:hypothetical protein